LTQNRNVDIFAVVVGNVLAKNKSGVAVLITPDAVATPVSEVQQWQV